MTFLLPLLSSQEICVGILGNIACFPETCLTLSQNNDLGWVTVRYWTLS